MAKKTAKIWWKTPTFSAYDTDIVIEKYIQTLAPRLISLPKCFQEFDGKGGLTLVFSQTNERPIIAITKKSIKILADLGLDFSVDFCKKS